MNHFESFLIKKIDVSIAFVSYKIYWQNQTDINPKKKNTDENLDNENLR